MTKVTKGCETCRHVLLGAKLKPCQPCRDAGDLRHWQPSELQREHLELAEECNRLQQKVEHLDECLRVAGERANLAEAALTLACEETADHDCPEEFDFVEWTECKTCLRHKEVHYDAQRDVNCWKRYFVEKVGKTFHD